MQQFAVSVLLIGLSVPTFAAPPAERAAPPTNNAAAPPANVTEIGRQLAAKDAQIADLKKQIADKDAQIGVKDAQIAALLKVLGRTPVDPLKRLVQDYDSLLAGARDNSLDSDRAVRVQTRLSQASKDLKNAGELAHSDKCLQEALRFGRLASDFSGQADAKLIKALALYNRIKASPRFAEGYVEGDQAVAMEYLTDAARNAGAGQLRFINPR